MKFLFDIFPVIVFFVAYWPAGIYTATAIAIAATFAQIGWLAARGRKIEPMLWASLIIIVVFGGATLLLHDETFIKWKPTVLYWLFASGLLGRAIRFQQESDPQHDGKKASSAGTNLAQVEPKLGRFFLADGLTELVRRV